MSCWRLDHADAAALPWPGGTVDLICTSPPYNLGLAYDGVCDALPYGDYLVRARRWAGELYRVAADQGRACINVPLDTHNGGRHALYADWCNLMRLAGWRYRTTIVWTKGNGSTGKHVARGSLDSPHAINVSTGVEMIGVFHKGIAWARDRRGRVSDLSRQEWLEWTDGLWNFAPVNGSARKRVGHPAPFPEELPRRCIKLHTFTDDLVADPFVGSGTTLEVALALGRRCWAADLSARYVEALRTQLEHKEGQAA